MGDAPHGPRAGSFKRTDMQWLSIPVSSLKRQLSYDSRTGVLRWKIRKPRVRPGMVAGSRNQSGYMTVTVDGVAMKCHRVAWAIHHGRWPRRRVDHRDGNGFNNQIGNLREATHGQNIANSKLRSDSTSGVKGVHFQKDMQKWIAYVSHNGVRHHIGTFDCPNEAKRARDRKARELHGEFARSM